MDHALAFELLQSPLPTERLRAARYFSKCATSADLPVLSAALKKESVSYIKRALQSVTQTGSGALVAKEEAEPEISESVRKDVYNKAVEDVAGTLLHEIAPILGVLRADVAKSLPEYENSRAKHHLDRLVRLLEAIAELMKAAAVPRVESFDFAQLVRDCVEVDGIEAADRISIQGPSPFIITSDRGLLALAISNGLRNAVDATREGQSGLEPIVINWGAAEAEYWLAILDNGPGLTGPAESAFRLGSSTKQNHSGLGLAIARQAMDSLSGTIRLISSGNKGAIFDMRWCK